MAFPAAGVALSRLALRAPRERQAPRQEPARPAPAPRRRRAPPGAPASAPEVRWAAPAYGGSCHALTVEEADGAASRGFAETLCGLTLPGAGLAPVSVPFGAALCFPCVSLVTSEVPEQRDPFL